MNILLIVLGCFGISDRALLGNVGIGGGSEGDHGHIRHIRRRQHVANLDEHSCVCGLAPL